ncbi:MAG: hypothetical protein R3335_03720 [Anaerolineales bacterium]|nr:hypothetical protein [Anaerolineales bacterium]
MEKNTSLNTRLWRVILPAVVATGLLVIVWRLVGAQEGADCGSPNVPGVITTDTTLSGVLYAADDIVVQNGAVLTLTAGTQLTMCGEYDLRLNIGGSALKALGTPSQPIVIQAENPGINWGRIDFAASSVPVTPSTLQHVQLIDGGGNDPAEEIGALHVGANQATGDLTPIVDHLTVVDSGAYGVYVRVHENDATPIALSNITVTGSARHPMLLWASAVGGLGQGNTFTGNMTETIEVRHGGLGGRVSRSQNWGSQPVPYQVTGGDPDVLHIGGTENPILTIEPGTTVLMPADGKIVVTSGGLVAAGTSTEPITFSDSGGGPWEGITYNSGVDPSSRLSHISLLGTGGGLGFYGSLTIFDTDFELAVDHLNISGNPNYAGIYSRSQFLTMLDSRIENNETGVIIHFGGDGLLRRNIIQGNTMGGVVVMSNITNACVDAMGNYWGSPDGPLDSSNALDSCGRTTTNGGGGNAVSDDVLYEAWLPGEVNYWVYQPIVAKP